MKTLIASAAASLAAFSATAGGFTAEVIEPVAVPVVETGSAGSMGGIAPLLIALGVIAVAVAISRR